MKQLRAAIHTLGCRLNQAESNLLAEQLTAAGYRLVPFHQPADLGVIHTCTVTREADAKSRKVVRQFIRRNPGAYVAVIGCYAQMSAETIAEIDGVDLIIGNQEKLHLLDYVRAGKHSVPLIVRDKMVRDDFSIDFAGQGAPLRHRANLKIQDGCNFMCSYCIIPFARGRVRSRTMENLLDEARSLIGRGARELVLAGVNLGTYDFQGQGVYEVVQRLNELPDLARIRISSIEVTTIPESLFACMADSDHRLVPHLHVPLQSGSNRTLEAMRRNYSRETFLALLERAAESVPQLGLGTDILVGFPGESEEDFADTAQLLEQSPLHYVHIFKYSERPGSAASRLPLKSDPAAATERSATLHRISAEKKRAFYAAQVGACQDVLFEEEEAGYWMGYTGNYMRVAVTHRADLSNRLCPVRIDKVGVDVAYGTLAEDA